MEQKAFMIGNIPAVLWGPASDRLLVAVHGKQSDKADTVIGIAAEVAARKGCRTLSFDLPEHGARREEGRICNTQNCVQDLAAVMQHARTLSQEISVFGCSVGAYYAMLAYRDECVHKALFLSPVVDMERLVRNMMMWSDVTEERLEREREIATPVSTLYWEDYRYVRTHPVKWDKPTELLYGEKDALCAYEDVKAFAEKCGAGLTVLADSEHFFHTERQLACLREWLEEKLSARS